MNTVLKRGRGDCFRYIPTMLRAKYEVGQTARLAISIFFMVFQQGSFCIYGLYRYMEEAVLCLQYGIRRRWDIVATAFINLHFKRAGGRDHFQTILTSFKRRASNKDIQDNIQIIKQKYWDCFSPINSLWLEIKVDLLGNLLITQSPSKGHLV